MNLFSPWFFLTVWSFRKELEYTAAAFLIVLSLPFFAVFLLTHAGINIISDKLASVNVQTKEIQIHSPVNGEVISEIAPQVIWPAKGVITLEFGQSSSYQVLHTGIDIANPQGVIGDPVVAFMDGTVIYAGEIFWGYGKHIIIDHGNNITSVYAHLDKIFVHKGQKVELGQIIGHMGTTGWSTGPHLHFEIRVFGIPVNPRKFLD